MYVRLFRATHLDIRHTQILGKSIAKYYCVWKYLTTRYLLKYLPRCQLIDPEDEFYAEDLKKDDNDFIEDFEDVVLEDLSNLDMENFEHYQSLRKEQSKTLNHLTSKDFNRLTSLNADILDNEALNS